MPDPEEDRVGYKHPPRLSQFKPGQSGNPRGRAKGALGIKEELRRELDEWVTISADGKTSRIRKRRLIIKALAAKAAKGSVAAADKLLTLAHKLEAGDEPSAKAPPLSSTDLIILERMLGRDQARGAGDDAQTDAD